MHQENMDTTSVQVCLKEVPKSTLIYKLDFVETTDIIVLFLSLLKSESCFIQSCPEHSASGLGSNDVGDLW